jgi:hypothetical protein
MDDYEFDFGGGDDFDISSFLGDSGSSGVDFGGFDMGPEAFDISSLLGGDEVIDLSGLDMGPEAFDISSLLGGDSGLDLSGLDMGPEAFDLSSMLNTEGGDEGLSRSFDPKRVDLAEYERNLLGPGDFDQAAPPANIAELMSSMNASSPENLAATDFNALYNEGLTPEQVADREKQMDFYKDKNQDFGGADVMQYFDEYDKNMTDIMQNKGGFTSQWQDVGGNKVMINDDPQGGSTATVFNPTTGKTSFLTEEQTQALIANGTLNTKGSGYVDATGGKGFVPGGGQTFYNNDGTKTVVTTDGKVLKVDNDGKVTDTGKKVDVNNETQVKSTCPSPEMLILLSSGEQRKAGDLQVGDEVKTQHETTMEWGDFKVTHAEIVPNAKRLNIKLDGKDFICSVDHKFYKDGAWVDAKDIKVGDVLSDKVVTEVADHSTGDVVRITVDEAHTYICEGVLSHNKSRVPTTPTTPTTTTTKTDTKTTTQKPADKKDNNMLMMLLALMAMMNKGGGSPTGSGGTIPSLQANRSQLPYGPISGSQARPGAGGVNYFSPTTYTQKAAGGGMMYGGGGISDLGGYSDGGRLLKGPGDGVSDSIPATIGGKQPARLAEGEFVVPARIVSELGNGSTEAGAKKLYAMMDRVQKARRKTKNVAADTKAHKYLPA